jgi:hypothetical protein
LAIAQVASQIGTHQSGSSDNNQIFFPNDVTAGNFIIVSGGIWSPTAGITSVTVTKYSGTATLGAMTAILGSTGVALSGRAKAYLAYAPITGSGSLALNVTTNLTGNVNYNNDCINEFSGTSITLDVNGGEATGNSNATAVDTITTLAANDLILGAIVVPSSGFGWSPGSGYTMIYSDDTASIQPYACEFRLATTAGSYNVGFGYGTATQDWSIVNAAFKETTAGVPRQAMHARRMRS